MTIFSSLTAPEIVINDTDYVVMDNTGGRRYDNLASEGQRLYHANLWFLALRHQQNGQ